MHILILGEFTRKVLSPPPPPIKKKKNQKGLTLCYKDTGSMLKSDLHTLQCML